MSTAQLLHSFSLVLVPSEYVWRRHLQKHNIVAFTVVLDEYAQVQQEINTET